MPKYFSSFFHLGIIGESAVIDSALCIRIRALLHLALPFPNTHMYLAQRDGGFGCLKMGRVALEVQLKALAQIVRVGNRAVVRMLNTTMGPYHCRLASQLRSREDWWKELQAAYLNKDPFAHQAQALGNTWLQHDSRNLKDSYCIKALP
ncbi:hypothetical protein IscW_ISCW002718 [Ixodes scapularis]|uniref:Uncharacterized protein n=1 Tax=Ixodes scapularis TaxID=6945 RepID=B7PD30_IXOSC|nr:hypothetical protein IscW_ISCW002718 [Ixodes scapularis]|eukprot:XP_002410592.1 hypothetical protein IscW_ISCW002718 [Ixodes scapularis]